ncbi:hypothetical protein L198_05370 [Cryptococcus wingfieldii CBS 7118]|uniref:Uncharacterized protein n=1 Tax=Cryptococcus wingfieldii CBS 7118 TaxID=1295528 RepID=A0A1E3IYK1_9TREE|nr:hypothetical protein L198_05370 [Cryptococcus wingfieldii CBS 7118]ODN93505.1 hypothetical protein L198_05370 [Cryptococcus wingfieldii CBS 7118]
MERWNARRQDEEEEEEVLDDGDVADVVHIRVIENDGIVPKAQQEYETEWSNRQSRNVGWDGLGVLVGGRAAMYASSGNEVDAFGVSEKSKGYLAFRASGVWCVGRHGVGLKERKKRVASSTVGMYGGPCSHPVM